MQRIPRLLACLLIAGTCARARSAEAPFALRDGDRVVFYGDSITQDGGYGRLVEQFTRSRFPQWNIRFYNAGVGGDTVKGGWAGESSVRVVRDLTDLKPTVVTIMLGMNDGGYRALDKARLDSFTQGYRAILAKVREALPEARVYLIRTSPFDDVTRPPGFGSGYDAVLRQLGEAVAAIGAENHLEVVDFGTCVDKGLKAVWASNQDLAKQLLPDRVHPSPAGHMVMGACLLRAWNAPALVSRVEIDAGQSTVVSAENTAVTAVATAHGAVTWKETDRSVPLPIKFDDSDADLAEKAGAGLQALDSEVLVVRGLAPGHYSLSIDGSVIGTFTADALDAGINLALYNTPMRSQAYQVRWGPEDGTQVQRVRRKMLVGASKGEAGAMEAAGILAADDETDQSKRSGLAIPAEHAYSLAPEAE